MPKLLSKFYVRVIISVTLGFFVAGTNTHMQYPCPPMDSQGCVSFEKAIMHPADLMHNKQDSLTNFVRTFAISSLVVLALLGLYNQLQAKKKA